MHRPGHYGASLLGYAPLATALLAVGVESMVIIGGGVAVGLAMVPDWDQRIPLISHRGITHTVWAALAIGVLLGVGALAVFGTVLAGLVVGLAAGTSVLSHIAADACTRMGVRPFAPLSRTKYKVPIYKVPLIRNPRADSLIANYVLLLLGIVAAAAAVTLGYQLQTMLPATLPDVALLVGHHS